MLMKWRPRKLHLLLASLGCLIVWIALEFGGLQRPYYSQTCFKCLDSERVRDVSVFGVVISRKRWTSQSNGIMAPGAQRVPSRSSATTHDEIMGATCVHQFKKMGCCRRSGWLIFSLTACGSYGEGMVYKHTIDRVADVFEAYARIGSKRSAKETYEMIFAKDPRSFSPKSWPLDGFETEEQWSSWLSLARSDPEFDLSVAPYEVRKAWIDSNRDSARSSRP